MSIHWGSLLNVFLVSLSSTVAVVVLVALALLGLSARAARAGPSNTPARHPLFSPTGGISPTAGTIMAVACLATAAGIVLLGLWAMVAR